VPGSRPVLLLMDFQHGLVERLGAPSVIDAADRAAIFHLQAVGRAVVIANFGCAKNLVAMGHDGFE